MARHIGCFDSENDFIECVRDFKAHMVRHLQNEQNNFLEIIEKCDNSGFLKLRMAQESEKSLDDFVKGQTPNVVNEIARIQGVKGVSYDIITFNYTTVVDELLGKRNRVNRVVHIHGRLDGDIVLGADNLQQLKDVKFPTTAKLERAFIKPVFNQMYDKSRIKRAEDVISESDVICIYGMSLGESDSTWVKSIIEWLLKNLDHHLVYYEYSNAVFEKWQRDEIMDEEQDRKTSLLNRICTVDEANKIFDQVHIPVGYNIFAYKDLIDNFVREKESLKVTANA